MSSSQPQPPPVVNFQQDPNRPTFVVSERPKLVAASIPQEQWRSSMNVFRTQDCLNRLLCTRCLLLDEYEFFSDSSQRCSIPFWLAVVIFVDVITAGTPFCFWMGAGTTVVGCQARSRVRRQYNIVGFGWHDLLAGMCCSPCVASQIHEEVIAKGMAVPKAFRYMT